MPLHDPKNLENFIQRALTSLPERRAPVSLEARVLAEIERLAALPWWRRSYAYWPALARGAFLVVSAAAAAVMIAGLMTLLQSAGSTEAAGEVARRFAWLGLARDTFSTLIDDGWTLFGAIPPLWLYGTLAFVAGCYLTLVGAAAAAYRVFFVRR
jgi:hypothetical protein